MDTINPNTAPTEAAVIAELATEAANAVPAKLDIALPGGKILPAIVTGPRTKITHLEHLLPAPLRMRGTTSLLTLKDLHQFINRQCGPRGSSERETNGLNPVIYADYSDYSFTAILNHPTLIREGWMDYRAEVKLTKSRQLQVWQGKNKVKMSQENFALFLEEYLQDISEPVAADVLKFAETLEATRTEKFKSSIRTSTGECNLTFSSERDGDQSTKLIEEFTIAIPLFEGDDHYAIKVKLYHRVIDQKLIFWYELRELDYIMETAWDKQVDFLTTTATELADVYEGTAPESMERFQHGATIIA